MRSKNLHVLSMHRVILGFALTLAVACSSNTMPPPKIANGKCVDFRKLPLGPAHLPEKPSKKSVSAGMVEVKDRVKRCGREYSVKGHVTVRVLIRPDGKVQCPQAWGGAQPVLDCVERAVETATFEESQRGVSVSYPFRFR